MPSSSLVDLVKVVTSTVGTGSSLVFGAAVPSFRSGAVLTDGATYSYAIQQGSDWEYGRGVWTAGTSRLSRVPIRSSNNDTPIALLAGAEVAIVLLAEDIDDRVGIPAELAIGSVTSGPTPSVTISGTSPNYVLDFVLEPGPEGDITPALTALAAGVQTNATQVAADRVQTGQDRVATGQDRVATAADRVQTGQDRAVTNTNANNTAADRVATAADRVQTGLDRVATAADRVQTGQDKLAAGYSAAEAAQSEDNAAQSAVQAAQAAHDVAPNSLSIGTVTKIAAGGTPTASVTGVPPNQTLSLGLVTGDIGLPGPSGPSGAIGLPAASGLSNTFASTAATYVPQGATAFALTPGSGGTNATNVAATFAGGNFTGNPTILFDIVGGAVQNVRVIDPGVYIGASASVPTVTLPGSAGGAALVLTAGPLIGNGSGYWAESADRLQLNRYVNTAGAPVLDSNVAPIFQPAGPKDVTLGFATPLLAGNVAWAANSTIWAFTSPNASTLKSIATQVNAVNSGALNVVIATGTLNPTGTSSLTFVASYPLTTITATGINTWEVGTGWTGTIAIPAGGHVLFSAPSGGADLQQQTGLTGFTRFTSATPFTGGTATFTAFANTAIRARGVVTETVLQVPRAGLADATTVATAASTSPAAVRVLNPSVSTPYGSTLTESGTISPFIANQIATIATVTANGVLETLTIDVLTANSGVLNMVVLNGTLPVVEKVSTTALTVAAGRNVFTSANFGTVNLTAGQTVALLSPTGGPLLAQFVKLDGSFYYQGAANLASGAGTLTIVPNFQIRGQITVATPALVMQKQNLGSELRGLSDLATPDKPMGWAIFMTAGQSNMQGANPQINPETIPAGYAYQWYNGAMTPVTADPIGNAVVSSILPSFVNRYIAMGYEGVILVPSALGSSGLAVSGSTGNWSSTGALRGTAITNLNAAKAAAALTASFTASIAGTTMTVTAVGSGTICPGHLISGTAVMPGTRIVAQLTGTAGSTGTYQVDYSRTVPSTTITQAPMAFRVAGILWSQGETDADTIDAGGNALTGGPMTGAKYETEFGLLNTYFQAQAGAGIPIIMSRTGYKSTGDTAGYQAIRTAQENIVRANPNVFMGYTGAITWTARSEIQSTYHGTTLAYAEMGKTMAVCAAYKCAGRV